MQEEFCRGYSNWREVEETESQQFIKLPGHFTDDFLTKGFFLGYSSSNFQLPALSLRNLERIYI